MNKFLVDASIVASSLLDESVVAKRHLYGLLEKVGKGQAQIISSKLLNLEVSNALRFEIKDQTKCALVLTDLISLPIKTLVLSKDQLKLSLQMSYEFRPLYTTLHTMF